MNTLNQNRPLTKKQKAFVQFYINNPKLGAVHAIQAAYGRGEKTVDYNTARAMASENLAKPNIMAYLADHALEAEETIYGVMRTASKFSTSGDKVGAAYATVARQAANDVLDRTYGKSTQRIEQSTSVVAINIDLTAAVQSP